MIRPVFNALNELLKFKGNANVNEIVRVSGKKPMQVLTVLNDNKSLYIKGKNDKVVGFVKGLNVEKAWKE